MGGAAPGTSNPRLDRLDGAFLGRESSMRLHHTTEAEPLYDRATLGKVVGLAERLKREKQDHLTVREMEAIGAEVGLEPAFIREALAQVSQQQSAAREAAVQRRAEARVENLRPREFRPQARGRGLRRPFAAAWWSAGWTLPLIGAASTAGAHGHEEFAGALFFLGWGVYIGGGILLSHFRRTAEEELSPGEVSRLELLDLLFTVQRHLEGQKERRAFLSVDVAGSTEMKRKDDLATEYSFGRFQAWAERTVRECGGELHAAAGDGLMCMFARDADAIRAARRLQEELPLFNQQWNRLTDPFRIRCGVSAGDVPVSPGGSIGQLQTPVIDRAAILQKRGNPGEVLVGSEVAGAALVELGGLTALAEPLFGDPAFVWRAS